MAGELDGLSQEALAERTGLGRTTVSSTLDALESAGVVSRPRDPTDRRRRLGAITASGRSWAMPVDGALERAERAASSGLDRRERERLRQLVEKALPRGQPPLWELSAAATR